jgi:phosphoglycolate phosphatase-like HAD superfamily hydrolase
MNPSAMTDLNDSQEYIIIDPLVLKHLGCIRFALFDFDGTLSLLREGWEKVMTPMMLEAIGCDPYASPEIEAEVHKYIDASTGILTIKQMEWLAKAVERYKLTASMKTPAEYKSIYLTKLLQIVQSRTHNIQNGKFTADDMMVPGSRKFLEALTQKGVILLLASGTDHEYVLNESRVLGIDQYFNNRIYGALDNCEATDKANLIRRILIENNLQGDELLVIGDGPVEMREASKVGAVALGVASNEVDRGGWNKTKIERLAKAGAAMLIPDFLNFPGLIDFLFHSKN